MAVRLWRSNADDLRRVFSVLEFVVLMLYVRRVVGMMRRVGLADK
jgi:hypothetical protein